MHDGIKLECINAINKEQLLANSIFNWIDEVDQETANIRWTKGRYHNLKIHVSNRSIEIKGSLHKLYNSITNGVEFNYNDYTFSQLVETVEHIERVFKMDTRKVVVSNLETSINAITTNQPTDIIKNGLIMWSRKSICNCEDFGSKGICKKFVLGESYSKFYDKGRKEGLDENLFRFEMCQKKNRALSKVIGKNQIVYLCDLLKIENAKKLYKHTVESFKCSIIIDDLGKEQLRKKGLNKTELEVIKTGSNPNHWNRIKGKAKQRFKQSFTKVVSSYGLDNDFKEILFQFRRKKRVLFDNLNSIQCHEIPTFENAERSLTPCQMTSNPNKVNRDKKTPPKSEPRYCKITNIDISSQKAGSEYLRETLLKKIKIDQYEVYQDLIKRFGPKSISGLNEGIVLERICKNIRNSNSNKNQQIKKVIKKSQNCLFPFETMMDHLGIDNYKEYLN